VKESSAVLLEGHTGNKNSALFFFYYMFFLISFYYFDLMI